MIDFVKRDGREYLTGSKGSARYLIRPTSARRIRVDRQMLKLVAAPTRHRPAENNMNEPMTSAASPALAARPAAVAALDTRIMS
ncbi:hypothetical protein EVAR_65563_1 [Eumeta japonica]|uniref:Uncharacterized protein n=1 Tax=Eumeta variegata TaxID=151549 RepID=A0A4C1Z9V4_EUMVA|nr:hypothetical protein EVAR_65563_1 [Eumeta japonica]